MKIPNLKVITAEERQRSVSIKVEMEYRFFVYETKVNNLPISKDRESFRCLLFAPHQLRKHFSPWNPLKFCRLFRRGKSFCRDAQQ